MKTYLHYYVFLMLLFCGGNRVFSQKISVDSSVSLTDLINNNLIKGCVEISNISSAVDGGTHGFPSYGYFNKSTSNFPFQDGVMLSTGNVTSGGDPPISTTLNDGSNAWGTDPDLEAALGIGNTLNATSIEFDLISISNQIQFNYLFASEEYSGSNICDFSDGFVILIKETASTGPYQNIALIPGTTDNITTTNIHDEITGQGTNCPAKNEQYFDDYNIGDTNYDGRTVPLTATANITPYVQYHIKLVIADQNDYQSDSAVFIEGISFNEVDLGDDISSCLSSATLNGDIQNPQASYAWYMDNTLIPGANNPTLIATLSGTYRVEVSVPLNTKTCVLEDEVNVTLNTEPVVNPISDYALCDDASGDETEIFDLQNKVPDILSVLPAGNYNLKFYANKTDARNDANELTTPIPNNTNPQEIYVSIENTDTGCFSFAPFNLVVNPLPTITDPSPLKVCDNDGTPNNNTDIDFTEKDDEITNGQPNLSVRYYMTQTDADSGNNPISSPYVNPALPASFTVYVRVQNTLTGCYKTTTLDVNVINSPVVKTDTQFIDACDGDHDGFASFDLTQVIPDVLQGLPASEVNPSFHLSYEEAESGSNPIADPTTFNNTEEKVQTVYLRVEDKTTGCPTIVPIEVHTNLLLTGTNIEDYALCDEDNNGSEDFYLTAITNYIANDLPNISVTYYENKTDLTNNNTSNALPANTVLNRLVDSDPLTLYIQIDNGSCSEQAEIKLLVNPVLLFKPLAPLEYCDSDEDGIVNVDLHSFDTEITGGNTNFEVHYFISEQEAIDNNINKEVSFYPVSGTKQFYARIVNIDSSCKTINSFEITVNPAPAVTQPSGITICDDDQDGFSIVNLDSKIPEIVTDTTGLNIDFFKLLNDAEAKTNPITNTTAYNANTQTVYVRVENASSGCFNITTIPVIVSTQPVFSTITDFVLCEDDGDRTAEFLFSDKDNEILNGQAGKEVLYFEDPNYTLPIDKNKPYQNTSSPQTIYVRVQNTIDPSCFGDTSFTINVSSNPIYNTNFTDFSMCDNSSNGGQNVFDLNEKITEISQGAINPLVIKFYKDYNDAANNAANVLPLLYNAAETQTVYVRIQETNSPCYAIEDLVLKINPTPKVSQPTPFEICDTDYDGFSTFDLNNADFELLDRSPQYLVINYFENEADVEDLSKEIANPGSYANKTNPQRVYIKVTNTLTTCYTVVPLDLIVNTPPSIFSVQTIQICDNDAKTYDLSEVNSNIVRNPETFDISYYTNLSDAQNKSGAISNIFNYTNTFYTFYIRIENPDTQCFTITSFNLQINPNPVANTPPNLESCDDDYDGFVTFDLSQQNNIILGAENPNNFVISYHSSQTDADNAQNSLPKLHAATNGEVIYARMENLATGCFDTTSFSTIVNPLPVININDIVPLCNNLPTTVIANTGNAGDTYVWSTGETTSEITIQPEDLGDYWVTVTTPSNCESTKYFSVIKSEEASINFTTTVDFADPNSITIDISGIGDYVYILDNGTPQTSNVFNNVTFGLHTVTIRDLNGCQDVSKQVVVIDYPKFVTPNNDGRFDTWQIVGIEEIPGTVTYIYDRYGKLLKTLPSYSLGWDGTFNGQNMPADDYWFVAKIKKDGVDFEVKGHFALKR